MQSLISYSLSAILLAGAIYFAVKGYSVGVQRSSEVGGHKHRAISYTIAIVCFLLAFEFFYPTWVALIWLLVALLGVWIEFWVAVSQIRNRRR